MAIQDIYDRLAQATGFHPGQTEIFDDFLLDAGDVVQIFSEGEAFDLPIFSQHIDWVGSAMTTLTSTGNKQRSDLPPLQKKQKNRSYRMGRRQTVQEEQTYGLITEQINQKDLIGLSAKAMGVLMDSQGNPILDEHGEYIWDNTSAAQIYSNLLLSHNRAAMVSAINNGTGDTISGAKVDLSAQGTVLIQAINNRPSQQSTVTIDADKINLNGVVNSTEMDARLINVDLMFANTGCAETVRLTGQTSLVASGAISAGSVSSTGAVSAGSFKLISPGSNDTVLSLKAVSIAGTTQGNLTLMGSGTDNTLAIPNAIATIVEDDNPPSGKIGFKYTTLASSTPVAVNFNIADTAKYKADVGIASVSAAGWTNDGEGGGYYNTVTATPKAGSASTETVVLPTITVDTELGTNASTALKAYGPAVSGTKYVVSTATTVYLKADSSYCYITKDNSTPTVGTNVLARISNPGGSPYSAYQIVASWNSYTPGTSNSTRGLRLYAQGKRVSDGAWENLASTTRTIRANHYWNDDEQKYQVTIT